MSGIYIPGIEIPNDCLHCPCADLEYMDCNLMPGSKIGYKKNLDNCPLVPVPNHGRLGDLDELKECLKKPVIMDANRAERLWDGWHKCTIGVWQAIDALPTIIPADLVKEGEG